ncbi:MAG: Na/Pi cotransporter family protein [Candidatus Limivicinus sp.]|nr:Na/Pi cotransporter family protein [Candidatus Limivicinus sp.]
MALFLFGMTLMGEGLKKVAGSKLELVLYKLSSTPMKGMLLGTGVTAVIQSSSATSVMVVGFVNSGMMNIRQAISIILGALIGTSVTGWIICLSTFEGADGWIAIFSTSTITAVVAVIGIILRMFSKKQSDRHVGDILLGFAVLMFGMQAMSGSVAPLKESESFIRLLTAFSNPLLGILIGAIFTSVLQSSSAAVGILQALSMTGAVSFSVAYPIILGIAIGAAVPVLLSALGAKVEGRRTALAYLVIEIIGVMLCAAIFYGADSFADFAIKGMIMDPVSVASVNSIFRIITTLALLPAVGMLEQIVTSIVKESQAERSANEEFDRLDERFLSHPALAIEQSRLTINSMARTSRENICSAMALLFEYDEKEAEKVESREDLVDSYEDRLGTYLMKLTRSELSREESESLSKYLHTLSDFERISDHAMNVCEAAQEINEKKIRFSPDGAHELLVLSGAVNEILDLSFSAFIEENIEKAYMVEPLEECIDVLCDEIKLRHVDRLQGGTCSLQSGFVFNDILTNFERVADHCSNVAIAMIELRDDTYDTHDYVISLKELRSHNFDELYGHFTEKFKI